MTDENECPYCGADMNEADLRAALIAARADLGRARDLLTDIAHGWTTGQCLDGCQGQALLAYLNGDEDPALKRMRKAEAEVARLRELMQKVAARIAPVPSSTISD